MIISCGTDIIETKRMKDAVNKWDKAFLDKIFTEKELQYSMRKKFYCQHLAARFAAKEAVFKAFGEGFSSANFKDIEITNDKNGKPSVYLKGQMKELAEQKGVGDILVSMSHTRNYAQAMAIFIGKDETD